MKLKVLSVESINEVEEKFRLKGENIYLLIVSRTLQKDLFIRLMDCLKYNDLIDEHYVEDEVNKVRCVKSKEVVKNG